MESCLVLEMPSPSRVGFILDVFGWQWKTSFFLFSAVQLTFYTSPIQWIDQPPNTF